MPHALIVVKLKTISYHALAARSSSLSSSTTYSNSSFFIVICSILTEIKIMDYFILSIKEKEDDDGDEEQ